jgi:Fe-S-cluster containining protein
MSEKGRRPPSSPEELTPHLQERLQSLVPRLIELGLGCVHSAESETDGGTDSSVDCLDRIHACRAVCCSYRFALTESEADGEKILWDRQKPYFIAHGGNGYCTHHDTAAGTCLIWENRPLRCRRYDCRSENTPWKDAERHIIRPGTFDHLPGKKPW